jgi:hypothetical protein
VSRAEEFHPHALPELDVSLSAHPAPIQQSPVSFPPAQHAWKRRTVLILAGALAPPISGWHNVPVPLNTVPWLHPFVGDFLAVGSEEAHLTVLTSVRLPNWTCRFPASSFHKGERLLGCKEEMRWINFTLSTNEWTFLSPSGLIQSASLLGRTGSGFSLRELSSCLTLLICPSGSFLLSLSVAFPNFL